MAATNADTASWSQARNLLWGKGMFLVILAVWCGVSLLAAVFWVGITRTRRQATTAPSMIIGEGGPPAPVTPH